MMRRLVVNIPDDVDLWLSKEVNQNEIVRKALRLYHQDITTDMAGVKRSYELIRADIKKRFEKYDLSFEQLDKWINILESRM